MEMKKIRLRDGSPFAEVASEKDVWQAADVWVEGLRVHSYEELRRAVAGNEPLATDDEMAACLESLSGFHSGPLDESLGRRKPAAQWYAAVTTAGGKDMVQAVNATSEDALREAGDCGPDLRVVPCEIVIRNGGDS